MKARYAGVIACGVIVLIIVQEGLLFDKLTRRTPLAMWETGVIAANAGILLVDYLFLKKQYIHLRSIFEASPSGQYYYTKGFNFLALGGIIVGQFAYFGIYDPFTDEAHELFRFLPATVAAFSLPALIYWAGMKFWLEERYKRKLGAADLLPARLIKPNI